MATILEATGRQELSGESGATVIEADADSAVVLPEGFALSDADFARSGDSMTITAADGQQVVIRDYFGAEGSPDLTTPDGGRMSGDLATQLSGPMAPGQVAQAGTGTGGEPIGLVESASGTVIAVRTDGTRVELEVGDPVFQGDVLETGEDGSVGVTLADNSTFSMAEDGRMVLDEMIYDPGVQEGSLSLSVVQGIFTFVSGEIAKTDPDAMVVDTPVATIGIRGTQVGIEIPNGEDLNVVLMEELDGFVGEVVILNDGGVTILNGAY